MSIRQRVASIHQGAAWGIGTSFSWPRSLTGRWASARSAVPRCLVFYVGPLLGLWAWIGACFNSQRSFLLPQKQANSEELWKAESAERQESADATAYLA